MGILTAGAPLPGSLGSRRVVWPRGPRGAMVPGESAPELASSSSERVSVGRESSSLAEGSPRGPESAAAASCSKRVPETVVDIGPEWAEGPTDVREVLRDLRDLRRDRPVGGRVERHKGNHPK